jgi:hypothetical protein
MPVGGTTFIQAEYLDLSTISETDIVYFATPGSVKEFFFSSLDAAPQDGGDRYTRNYDTGYYVDAGVTKLIPVESQYYSSNQTSSIYGVLELQEWANGNPPRNKSAIQP